MNKLLTLSDVCSTLQLSRASVYRQIQRGKLRKVKIGGALRFRSVDVERLIKENVR